MTAAAVMLTTALLHIEDYFCRQNAYNSQRVQSTFILIYIGMKALLSRKYYYDLGKYPIEQYLGHFGATVATASGSRFFDLPSALLHKAPSAKTRNPNLTAQDP